MATSQHKRRARARFLSDKQPRLYTNTRSTSGTQPLSVAVRLRLNGRAALPVNVRGLHAVSVRAYGCESVLVGLRELSVVGAKNRWFWDDSMD